MWGRGRVRARARMRLSDGREGAADVISPIASDSPYMLMPEGAGESVKGGRELVRTRICMCANCACASVRACAWGATALACTSHNT